MIAKQVIDGRKKDWIMVWLFGFKVNLGYKPTRIPTKTDFLSGLIS